MISKQHRFHGHNSLSFVYSKGRVCRNANFAIKSIVNPRRDKYRAAVVVSKKVAKLAVERNRIRRVFYEIIRLNQDKINGNFDIVITIFSPVAAEPDSKTVNSQVVKLLKQSGVIDVGVKKDALVATAATDVI